MNKLYISPENDGFNDSQKSYPQKNDSYYDANEVEVY